MERRWRQRRENYNYNYNYNHSFGRSQHRKPPRANQHLSVPTWEKDFCRVVGTMDWGTLLQLKQYLHLYSNVLTWDDSAAKEAFENAKKRYWAAINGLPCDIPLPDPDLYIDEINWDSVGKTEMLPDIDRLSLIPTQEGEHKPVVIFGDSFVKKEWMAPLGWDNYEEKVEFGSQPIVPTGWGDDDEKVGFGSQPIMPTGWGDGDEKVEFGNQGIIPTGWGDDGEKAELPANDPPENFIREFMQYQSITPTGWGDDKDEARNTNQEKILTGWGDNDDGRKVELPGNDALTNFVLGDSFVQYQHFTPTSWGDNKEDKIELSEKFALGDCFAQYQHIKPTGWGDDEEEKIEFPENLALGDPFAQYQSITPTGWGDEEDLNLPADFGNPWEQNINNATPTMPWVGNRNDAWGQSYNNMGPGQGQRLGNNNSNNVGRYRPPKFQGRGGRHKAPYGGEQSASSSKGHVLARKWNSVNACGRFGAAATGGQMWKWQKRVS